MNTFDLPVEEFLTWPVVTIHPDAALPEAERRMLDHRVSCLAVTDTDGRIQGVLSRTDLLRIGRLRASMNDDPTLLHLPQQTVRTRMITDVVSVSVDTSMRVAAQAMLRHHIHRVFVLEEGRPVGVVSTRDLMKAVQEERVADPIGAWMSRPVLTVDVGETVARATDRLSQAHVRGVVVLEGDWPVGVFTQTEALMASALEPDVAVEEAMSCALLCLPMTMPVFRAAAFSVETRARRVLAVETRELRGILSGLDFARVVAGDSAPHPEAVKSEPH